MIYKIVISHLLVKLIKIKNKKLKKNNHNINNKINIYMKVLLIIINLKTKINR